MIDRDPKLALARPRRSWFRLVVAIVAYTALLSLGYWGSGWLTEALGLRPGDDALIVNDGAIWLGISAYALLLATPFVPGIEISLGLLATFGSAVAVQVYLATVAALVLSYSVGRIVPSAMLSASFLWFGLTSADALVKRLGTLSQKERLALLVDQAPHHFVPPLLRYRYVALVVAFNLPGNAILGGGGGIALLAGLSGVFSSPLYVIAASVAALPVPLAALLMGRIF
jgi:hypothetical protein